MMIAIVNALKLGVKIMSIQDDFNNAVKGLSDSIDELISTSPRPKPAAKPPANPKGSITVSLDPVPTGEEVVDELFGSPKDVKMVALPSETIEQMQQTIRMQAETVKRLLDALDCAGPAKEAPREKMSEYKESW